VKLYWPAEKPRTVPGRQSNHVPRVPTSSRNPARLYLDQWKKAGKLDAEYYRTRAVVEYQLRAYGPALEAIEHLSAKALLDDDRDTRHPGRVPPYIAPSRTGPATPGWEVTHVRRIGPTSFRVKPGSTVRLKDYDTGWSHEKLFDGLTKTAAKERAGAILTAGVKELAAAQDLLLRGRPGTAVLVVLQAMDAAWEGRHDQARHVRGQPAGCEVYSFTAADAGRVGPHVPVAVLPVPAGAGADRDLQTGRTTRTCWW